MDDQMRNRRLGIGAIIVALLGYAAYSRITANQDHRHARVTINDDGDTSDNAGADNTTDLSGSQISVDNGNGVVGIKIPGFSGDVKMPGIKLDKANMNLDGVPLFPGATVTTMNVHANGGDDANTADVMMGFKAPAPVAKVHDYYAQGLVGRGYKIAPDSTPTHLIADKEDADKRIELTLTSVDANTTAAMAHISVE